MRGRNGHRMTFQRMTPQRFEKIAYHALETLPQEFRPFIEACVLTVEPAASDELRRELELEDDEELYGLYEGTALIDRSVNDPPEPPPRVRLFYESLLADCETEEELVHEIQVTVLHEIGHHFGLDESDLEKHGYG